MPLEYRIDERAAMLRITGHGDVTVDDAFRLGDAIRGDPAFHPSLRSLIDLRAARLVGKTHALWRLATRAHELTPASRGTVRGAFVTSDLLVFGVARMYALLASNEKTEFMVFKSLDDALAYLDEGGSAADVRGRDGASGP